MQPSAKASLIHALRGPLSESSPAQACLTWFSPARASLFQCSPTRISSLHSSLAACPWHKSLLHCMPALLHSCFIAFQPFRMGWLGQKLRSSSIVLGTQAVRRTCVHPRSLLEGPTCAARATAACVPAQAHLCAGAGGAAGAAGGHPRGHAAPAAHAQGQEVFRAVQSQSPAHPHADPAVRAGQG